MKDEAVCKTAPVTPGLLMIDSKYKFSLFNFNFSVSMCIEPVYESFILILSYRRSIKIVRLSRIVGCFSPTAGKWSNSDQIFSEEK